MKRHRICGWFRDRVKFFGTTNSTRTLGWSLLVLIKVVLVCIGFYNTQRLGYGVD